MAIPAPDLTDVSTMPAIASGSCSHGVVRTDITGSVRYEADTLADEVAIALEYNDLSHATLLATPANLEDLAMGFSFTEGIIRSASDIYDIDVIRQPEGWVVQIKIASACLNQLKLRRRQMAGRTGCGLCGLETLSQVQRDLTPVPTPTAGISVTAIAKAAAQLRDSQPLHLLTGATHGAAWATLQGDLLQTREDVGRHNALDKLIGWMLYEKIDTRTGFIVISSRASFEMVQKAAAIGVAVVVAVSAPTAYAVRMATDLNVLLAGFVRNDKFTVYSHPEFLADTRSPV